MVSFNDSAPNICVYPINYTGKLQIGVMKQQALSRRVFLSVSLAWRLFHGYRTRAIRCPVPRFLFHRWKHHLHAQSQPAPGAL